MLRPRGVILVLDLGARDEPPGVVGIAGGERFVVRQFRELLADLDVGADGDRRRGRRARAGSPTTLRLGGGDGEHRDEHECVRGVIP